MSAVMGTIYCIGSFVSLLASLFAEVAPFLVQVFVCSFPSSLRELHIPRVIMILPSAAIFLSNSMRDRGTFHL